MRRPPPIVLDGGGIITAVPLTLILLLVPSVVVADLPVHCLRTQLEGKWRFHLSEPSKTRTTCGHQTPDVDKKQPKLDSFKAAHTLELELKSPATGASMAEVVSTGESSEDSAAEESDSSAAWTMIYDEGVSVKTASHEFFGFSHFRIPEGGNVGGGLTVHGKKLFQSLCGKTEIGWYRDTEKDEYGCFKGEKVGEQRASYHLSLLDELESKQR